VAGETSGILIESIQMYFDLIADGTPASGAVLNIQSVKPEMFCNRCKKNFVRKRCSFECPDCGSMGTPTEIGKEFYIDKIELEV
jgi:hydrogenase nickel incorporation protein HypA/HybF